MTDRAVTFIRKGDFYEYEGFWADKIARALDVALTKDAKGNPNCVGFPVHMKDYWALPKLDAFGYKVELIG